MLNPQQEAFFQKPKYGDKFQFSDSVWFDYKSLGVNRLAKIMRTNHCVRGTAITLWSDSCVPARHIISFSVHSNEQSLASYNRRPSTNHPKRPSSSGECTWPNHEFRTSSCSTLHCTVNVGLSDGSKCLSWWHF